VQPLTGMEFAREESASEHRGPRADLRGSELYAYVQDLSNRPDWAAILDLEPQLRADADHWRDLWAPLLAVAARHEGRPHARRYLDEAIAAGFAQPEILEGEIEKAFGTDADWPALQSRMLANLPAPTLELTGWPQLSSALPLSLRTIAPDRLDVLLQRLPEPSASAFQTATALLHWVGTRWDHAGSAHVDWYDAVHVLDRVEAGERFACREYMIVLSQALNALGIPARSVGLLRERHDVGMGRAHSVCEAWIDDLGRWIVLDGQNAMYWVDDDGHPLGVTELVALQQAGAPAPAVVSVAGKASARAEVWWPYFCRVQPTGFMLSTQPYEIYFEGHHLNRFDELRHDPAGSWPDLLEVGLGMSDVDGCPALQPVTRHPYATGFEVRFDAQEWHLARDGQPWPLPRDNVGEHTATIATVTPYGVHRPHPVGFVVR
jgi:transglutaminase superfamily protein